MPTIRPKGPVEYVFVGTEPSMGRWAKSPAEAKQMIALGLRNFSVSYEDFILHFAIQEYLKPNLYYLTDVAKGAMLVNDAQHMRYERYRDWEPLLREEMNLVAREGAKTIAIGNDAADALNRFGIENVGTILHYSPQAARHRSRFPNNYRPEFQSFMTQVSHGDICQVARSLLADVRDGGLADSILQRILGADLSESRQELLFTYKKQFEALQRDGRMAEVRDF